MERESLEAEGQEGAGGFARVALSPNVPGKDVANVAVSTGGVADLDPASADQPIGRAEHDSQVIGGSRDGLPGRLRHLQEPRGVLGGVRPPVEMTDDRSVARVRMDGGSVALGEVAQDETRRLDREVPDHVPATAQSIR